jgi:NADH dehydrogenase
MASKLVTVFGGSGFIGRHLVRRLADAGWRVRVAVRHPNAALFLKPMGSVGQIQLVQANVRDERSTARAIEGAHAVVNLVGVLAESGHQKFNALHAMGAERIARLSAAAGVARLVHVSAIGADRESESGYASSKARGEAGVLKHFPKATILRPSVVFGPEDQLFNRFAAMARIYLCQPLIGGGETRFQPVHVGDGADAICQSILQETAEGKVYELGGPQVWTLKEIMAYVLKVTGRKRALVPLPFGLAGALAALTGWLPGAPLTSDQVRMLKADNVADPRLDGFKALGLIPDSVEANVPAYLWRFRAQGQFTEPAAQ